VVEKMSVRPIPTVKSSLYLFRASLVILFLVSSVSTLPIRSEAAKDFVSAGSETGLSLLICGKSCFTG